jgi:gliding motility-associated-like protein
LIRFFSLLFATSLFNAIAIFAQPSFTAGGDITVDQNSGAYGPTQWATNIVATTPSFEIQSINFVGFLTFATDPAIDAAGNLTFEPTADRSGIATITVVLKDLSNGTTSIPATFKINVNFINSAPTFTVVSPDQTIDEKDGAQIVLGWATDISAGPNPDEVTQNISFSTTVISQSAYMSFVQAPKVDKSGTLTYEVDNVANGTATVEVILQDDGSDTPPNSNSSPPMTFIITVNPINDPPTFTISDNINIDEHTGAVSIANWAMNISAGPPDEEASQNVTFVVNQSSISTYLQFDVPVSVDANGTISFTATPHYNGVAVYEIYLLDDGPSTPPHDNKSSSLGFSVIVDYINDAPTFTVGADTTIDEGDNIYIIPNWATNISPGVSPNEQDQQLQFTVIFQQVTGSLAFLRMPEVDTTGQLIFQATEHTYGEAIFDIYLVDDGDFEAPHENQSPKQSFTITVNKVNYPPNDIFLSNTTVLEKQPAGTFVGNFTTADLDPEDTHTYALVPGEGSEDNDSFTLDGDDLLTNEEFDWKIKTDYTIRVKTSDGEFSFEKSFFITVEKLIEGIKFANAITPNNDGENDTWELEDIEAFPDATVFIYDNAGRIVFKSRQGYNPWDGTFNGQALPMGTYYYVIDLHDGINVYKGTVTIIL